MRQLIKRVRAWAICMVVLTWLAYRERERASFFFLMLIVLNLFKERR